MRSLKALRHFLPLFPIAALILIGPSSAHASDVKVRRYTSEYQKDAEKAIAKGDYEQAARIYAFAIEDREKLHYDCPTRSLLYRGLASVYEKLGRSDDEIRTLETGIARCPFRDDAYKRLAELLRKAGKDDAASKVESGLSVIEEARAARAATTQHGSEGDGFRAYVAVFRRHQRQDLVERAVAECNGMERRLQEDGLGSGPDACDPGLAPAAAALAAGHGSCPDWSPKFNQIDDPEMVSALQVQRQQGWDRSIQAGIQQGVSLQQQIAIGEQQVAAMHGAYLRDQQIWQQIGVPPKPRVNALQCKNLPHGTSAAMAAVCDEHLQQNGILGMEGTLDLMRCRAGMPPVAGAGFADAGSSSGATVAGSESPPAPGRSDNRDAIAGPLAPSELGNDPFCSQLGKACKPGVPSCKVVAETEIVQGKKHTSCYCGDTRYPNAPVCQSAK